MGMSEYLCCGSIAVIIGVVIGINLMQVYGFISRIVKKKKGD